MFLVTLVFLLEAAICVEIAIKTYRSADEGGKELLEALKGAAKTLREQTETLRIRLA